MPPLPRCRSSWTILPGCSSDTGSYFVPWRSASVRSTPRARSGSNDSVISAVEQRVAAEQGHEPRSASRSQRPIGMLLVDDAQRSEVGERPIDRRTEPRVGGDHRRRPLPPSGHTVDGDCLGRRIERSRRRPRCRTSSAAMTLMLIVADPRGASSRCQLNVPAAGSTQQPAGSSAHASPRRSSSRSTGNISQPSSSATIRPGARCRPPLTSNTWAKSAPISTSRSTAAGCVDVWRTSISSRMPPAIHRRRITRHDERSSSLRIDDALHDHRRREDWVTCW